MLRGKPTPVPAENPGRDCETLDGGSDYEVFFRPQRYRPADLGSVVAQVSLADARGLVRSAVLADVSQNGVAFEHPEGLALSVGEAIPGLTISLDGYTAYSGKARVVSVRHREGGQPRLVGAAFIDGLMNIDDVHHLQQVSHWKGFASQGIDYVKSGWYVPGCEVFKAKVSECRLFLEDVKGQLDALEASLPWHVVYVDSESAVRAALIHRIRSELIPVLLRLTVEVDAALRGATREEWQHLKEFSIRNVHDLLMAAPVLYRARVKPLGYPGDYEVMRFVYDQHFEGTTLFGKALHLFACACHGPCAVRARKDLVKGLLQRSVEEWRGPRPLKVATVASGPAQELIELLAESAEALPPMEVLLFDQDRLALTYVQGSVSRLLDRHPRVRVTYLYDSIKRLLSDPTLFSGYGPFDLIYCAGLCDYLRHSTAARLTGILYDQLVPGGRAYLGNMTDDNPGKWLFEHHLDWYLNYRTHQEMLDFGQMGAPQAGLAIVEEETRLNPFLEVRKD